MTDNSSGSTFVPQYRAISWPQAASETGVEYWDMSTWYGAANSTLMMDGNHCNAAGGRKIAVEMLNQILARFPATSVNTQVPLGNGAFGMPVFPGGLLSIGKKDASYEEQLFSTGGRLLAHLSGRGPFACRIGTGALPVPRPIGYVVAGLDRVPSREKIQKQGVEHHGPQEKHPGNIESYVFIIHVVAVELVFEPEFYGIGPYGAPPNRMDPARTAPASAVRDTLLPFEAEKGGWNVRGCKRVYVS